MHGEHDPYRNVPRGMSARTHNRLILAAVIVLAVIAVYLFFQVENAG